MVDLREEVRKLGKELKDRRTKEDRERVEDLLQSVKDYAASPEVNVDTLYSKLIRLEETARKVDHKDKIKYHVAIGRFLVKKEQYSARGLGDLIADLLASKEEHDILERERKVSKSLEQKQKPKEVGKPTEDDKIRTSRDRPTAGSYGRFRPYDARGQSHYWYDRCRKCGRLGHFAKDCHDK